MPTLTNKTSVAAALLDSSSKEGLEVAFVNVISFAKLAYISFLNNFSVWANDFKIFRKMCLVCSALGSTIGHIVFLIAKKEMIRVNTRPVVTFMTHKKFLIKRPVSNFIRKSMCPIKYISTLPNNSVAISINTSSPLPAITGFIDKIPKSIFCWNSFFRHKPHNKPYNNPIQLKRSV